jgi:hypothetical protein
VLISYLVANGIMIPHDWLDLFPFWPQALLPHVGFHFVMSSALCGAGHSLGQMVLFRLVQ